VGTKNVIAGERIASTHSHPVKKKTLMISVFSVLSLPGFALAFSGTSGFDRVDVIGSWNPGFGPGGYLAEGILKLPSFPGELVLDANRTLRDDRAEQQSLGLE
jgi:hypothetical protein